MYRYIITITLVALVASSCHSYKEEYENQKLELIWMKHELSKSQKCQDSLIDVIKQLENKVRQIQNDYIFSETGINYEMSPKRRVELERYFQRSSSRMSTQLGESSGLSPNPKYDVSTYKINGQVTTKQTE